MNRNKMGEEQTITAVLILQEAGRFFLNAIVEKMVESSSSESEDENELAILTVLTGRTNPREREIPRIENYYERTIPRYTPSDFQSHFRMTREAFNALCMQVIPRLRQLPYTTGRPLDSPEKKLLAVIWLLATPDSYRSVGEKFNLGKASLSDAFVKVIKVLTEMARMLIKWPSEENSQIIMQRFYGFAGMNNVIGAVDGTYVPIKAPKKDPHVYVTRKHNYAMTLQAIAEPSLKFIDASCAYPGSVSDTRIFRNSEIYNAVTENPGNFFHNNFLLGDKAYPLLEWCIPPYIERQRLTAAQQHFNTIHAKTRQVIERAFALLFGRFRRLKYLDMNRIDLIPITIIACCVLHNICLDHADLEVIEQYIQEGLEFMDNNNQEREDILFPGENNPPARQIRDNISLDLFNRRRNNAVV